MKVFSSYKGIFINSLFTISVFSVIIICILEGKPYFINSKEKEVKFLSGGLETYKVKMKNEIIGSKNSTFNIPTENLYNTSPSIKIQKLVNIYELEEEDSYESSKTLPEEIIGGILTNPIFKGYYLQLGIFEDKKSAQGAIENISSNPLIKNGSFTTYIETRYSRKKPLYLAQIGIFSSMEDALGFCEKLQKSSINCLLIN